jgi:hypothetical protein
MSVSHQLRTLRTWVTTHLMNRMLLLAAVVIISGCHERHKVNRDPQLEAKLQEIRASYPGMTEKCLNDLSNGGSIDRLYDPDCFKMLPDQRWTGLWNTGWEWTNFCPDPAKQCPTSAEHGSIWMEFAKGAYGGLRELPDGVYRVDFVGRRTKVSGHFGHQGYYDHLMVVDRMISIGKIPGEKYTKRF